MAAKKKVKKIAKKPVKKVVAKKKTTAKKVIAKKKAAPKKAVKKVAAKLKPNPAFMRPLTPSDALAAVVGAKPLPRTEVVKKMWVYIKANKLQDSVNKRNINADEVLKAIFGKAQVTMFEMAKLLAKHLS